MREALVGFLFSTLRSMVDEFDGKAKAWVARETGIVHVRNDEYMDDETPLPADVEDDERYVPVPDIKQLDLGKRLEFRFTEAHMPGDEHAVRESFRKKGAYSRFSDLVAERGETDG